MVQYSYPYAVYTNVITVIGFWRRSVFSIVSKYNKEYFKHGVAQSDARGNQLVRLNSVTLCLLRFTPWLYDLCTLQMKNFQKKELKIRLLKEMFYRVLFFS